MTSNATEPQLAKNSFSNKPKRHAPDFLIFPMATNVTRSGLRYWIILFRRGLVLQRGTQRKICKLNPAAGLWLITETRKRKQKLTV